MRVFVFALVALGACGTPQTTRSAVLRLSGTADPMFTGVRAEVAFVATSESRACRSLSASTGEWEPNRDVLRTRAEVQGGRYAADLPLERPEQDRCGWEPSSVSVEFERGGREGDPRTQRGFRFGLASAPEADVPPRPDRVALPDSVVVVCRPAPSVRPVQPRPVVCADVRGSAGGPVPMPSYVAGAPPRALRVDVSYLQAYDPATSARYDTTALNRAYGVEW